MEATCRSVVPGALSKLSAAELLAAPALDSQLDGDACRASSARHVPDEMPGAPAASVAPTPAGSAQLPTEISCSKLPGNNFGPWTPDSDDLLRAAALANPACIPAAQLGEALRACATQAASTRLKLATVLSPTTCEKLVFPCQATVTTAEAAGRKWIVFRSSDRGVYFAAVDADVSACSTYGFVQHTVIEMTSGQPVSYMSKFYRHEYGEHLNCQTDLPSDFASLPAELQAYLCSELGRPELGRTQ